MCHHTFNKYKVVEVVKRDELPLKTLQFSYKGFGGGESSQKKDLFLQLSEHSYLYGLPSNSSYLNDIFLMHFKESLYFQIGDYQSAVKSTFDSCQALLQSTDSLNLLPNKEKLALSVILIEEDNIVTLSTLPTYGLIIVKDQILFFNEDEWNTKGQRFESSLKQLSQVIEREQFYESQIIFGISVSHFNKTILLSSFMDDEQKCMINFNEVHQNSYNYYTRYFKQYEGPISDAIPPCGFIIDIQNL